MTPAEQLYLAPHPEMLPLYEYALEAIAGRVGPYEVVVHKTQITLRQKRGFAVFSLPANRLKEWPKVYLMLTFVLSRVETDPRVALSTQVSPHRFTHHVLLTRPEDLDERVLDWVSEAYAYATR